MELINLSCEGFLEELASKAAAPGGGGASALVGAAGVALGSMVGSLTVGKKKYAAVEADIAALNVRAEALRKQLEALVQADAEAFSACCGGLQAAERDPGTTAGPQGRGAGKALDRACAVPLEVMTACGEGIALAAEYAEKGQRPGPFRCRMRGAVLQGGYAGGGAEREGQHPPDGRQSPCGCAGGQSGTAAGRVCAAG